MQVQLRRMFAALPLMFGCAAAMAEVPAIARLQYAADIGANIVATNVFAARKDYVDDDLAGTRVRNTIAGLPDTDVLHDFQRERNGDLLFALDTGITLGGTYFSPADVIRWSGGIFSKAFDAAAAGVPRGVRCDGVARRGAAGPLLLSFDRTFTTGGVTIRPADVIAVNGNTFGAKLLDAQALGLRADLNVDAIDTFGTRGYLLVSFDRAGAIGALHFGREDVLQLRLADRTWSLRFRLREFSARWSTANLDGLAASNDDSIFDDGFE